MLKIPDDLNGALALNICRTRDGWQASLERSKGSFSVQTGSTPSEAIAQVLGVPFSMQIARPLAVTPCPVPVCPVSLPA